MSCFVLAVLLLNEREASGKVAQNRDTAAKNYRAAEKWFITAVSMANNEQEIVNALTEIHKRENRMIVGIYCFSKRVIRFDAELFF